MVESTASSPPYTARAAFIAWERLRVVYNLTLAVLVLAVAQTDWSDPEFTWQLAIAACLANLCFCLGPVTEGYLVVLLGADRRAARWFVFVAGLLLACGLAAAWLFSWRMWVGD
jgi:hypothetical protein